MTSIAPWALERIAAPKVEPVTLEEVKAYVKIDNSEEDALLSGLIVSAREMAERYLRLSLATQIFQLTIQGCVEADVHVPQGPVQSVASVETISRTGATATVDPATYELHVNRINSQTKCNTCYTRYCNGIYLHTALAGGAMHDCPSS